METCFGVLWRLYIGYLYHSRNQFGTGNWCKETRGQLCHCELIEKWQGNGDFNKYTLFSELTKHWKRLFSPALTTTTKSYRCVFSKEFPHLPTSTLKKSVNSACKIVPSVSEIWLCRIPASLPPGRCNSKCNPLALC